MNLTEPIDQTHRESLEAVRQIRRRFAVAVAAVAKWEPAPPPVRR